MAHESHTIKAMVHGYHVYKEILCAAIGEELPCKREVENHCDPFAVAVVRSGVIVSYIQMFVDPMILGPAETNWYAC